MRPFTIVSLWDMLQLDAYLLIDATAQLAQAREFFRMIGHGQKPVKIGEDYAKLVDKAFDRAHAGVEELELPLSQNAVERARKIFEKFKEGQVDHDAVEVTMIVSALRDYDTAIWKECLNRTFFVLSSNETEYFAQAAPLFGESVAIKFAVVASDISEGGKCFALARYTACVFHLMRVMEFGIKKLGKKLKVEIDVEKETWYQIEQHINKAINLMANSTSIEQKKKQKYAAAAAGLGSVRIAWRNDVMHPKATYTEEEARRIMDHVGGFLNSLCPLI